MDEGGKKNYYLLIIVALIVISIIAAGIWIIFSEASYCSDRCIDLPGSPDQYYSIFNPVHMLAIDDEGFEDVPMNRIPSVYHTTLPVRYNSSDGSFSIEEVFEDEYSFDYYPDAAGDNMTIYYTPDVKLEGNRLSFDILIINRGNEDIEISNVSIKYRIEQLNGQCDIERRLKSDYTPDVLIHPREYCEIRVEVNFLSPDDIESQGICKYFNPNIWYIEDDMIEVTKRGSSYSYATNLRFEIKYLY